MKKIYLIFIFLMPLLITACNTGSIIGSGSADGIQIKFLQPTFPTDSIKGEGDQITVLLEVTNYAECDAIGKICIDDGALSDAFGGFNKARDCKQLNIPAATELNGKLKQNKEQYLFISQPYKNLFADLSDVRIDAIANYKCDVLMSSRVCVKSPLDQTSNCKLSETITGSSSGAKTAPVTLSSITKQVGLQDNGLKLRTTLKFKKMSKGFVIDEDGISQVKIDVTYSGAPMECSGTSGTDYKNGILTWKADESENIINCDILLSKQELNDPLDIHLIYDYQITEGVGSIRIKANKEA